MLKFPPQAADLPLLAKLRAAGVGPGLRPANAHLSDDTLRGLRDAVAQGPSKVVSAALTLYFKQFSQAQWLPRDRSRGEWGTNYTLRAIGDRLGIGGQRASIATYPLALFDDTKAPLTGSKRYVLHIPKSNLPIPVKAFWSLTMYDTNSFFVPNPLNRYLINNRSHLHTNRDGSIDIYVQHDEPSNPAQASNWLPAPASGLGFRLVWRLYDLDHAVVRACSMARAGSRRRCSPVTPPVTRPTPPPARPSGAPCPRTPRSSVPGRPGRSVFRLNSPGLGSSTSGDDMPGAICCNGCSLH